MLLLEMQSTEDNQSFPKETPAIDGRLRKPHHCQRVCLLVAYQHLGLYAVIVQRFHQTVSRYSSTTSSLTRIDNQYSHFLL